MTTSTINFLSDTIIAIEKDSTIYVPMKRICDNLGIAWSGQLIKINSDLSLSKAITEIVIPTEGGSQSTVCLPLKYMYGWLMKLNPSKVAPHVSDKLIQYQELIYDVIYNHFHPKSNSVEITNPDLITALNAIVKVLPTHNAQINALYDGYLKLSHQHDNILAQQESLVEEIKEAFQIVKSENLAAINSLKNSIIKANANSATPNGRMVTLAELKRDPALGPVAARFINNRSNQSLAQSLSFWTEHNGQKLGRSGSVNLYPYNLAITFFDESTNPYIKKYI